MADEIKSDAEEICDWMGLRWYGAHFVGYEQGWVYSPRTLDLDALWEVEEAIIQRGLADAYRAKLVKADAYFWHASAEQKTRALAATIRGAR